MVRAVGKKFSLANSESSFVVTLIFLAESQVGMVTGQVF
jgi:hypothetical protein